MNNNSVIPIIISSISGLATVIGGIFAFIKIKNKDKYIVFSLSLASSVMLTISIFELIKDSFYYFLNNYNLIKTISLSIILFLIGYLIIILTDSIINKNKNYTNLYKLGIMNMIVLMIHNIPEGILTYITSYSNLKFGIKIGLAIMIHNIPEGISIALPIYYASKSRGRAIIYTLISGLSEPFGAILTCIFLKEYISIKIINYILVIVAGIMTTLSLNKLLPEAITYKNKKPLIIGLIAGFILMIVNIRFL